MLDPATTTQLLSHALRQLTASVDSSQFAALCTADGRLIAASDSAQCDPMDRRGAIAASLIAVAQASARESGCGSVRSIVIECQPGLMVYRDVDGCDASLLLQLRDGGQLGRALYETRALSQRIQRDVRRLVAALDAEPA